MSRENINLEKTFYRDNEKYLRDKKIYRREQSNASLASEIKKNKRIISRRQMQRISRIKYFHVCIRCAIYYLLNRREYRAYRRYCKAVTEIEAAG